MVLTRAGVTGSNTRYFTGLNSTGCSSCSRTFCTPFCSSNARCRRHPTYVGSNVIVEETGVILISKIDI